MADAPLLGQAQRGKVVGDLAEHLVQGVGVGGEEIVRRVGPAGHRLQEGLQLAAAVGELDDVEDDAVGLDVAYSNVYCVHVGMK